MIRADSYDEVSGYLLRYASDDWLMLATVVDLADGLVGEDPAARDVAEMTMRLAGDLEAGGCPPGDLMDDDRDFIPWPGDRTARLGRLRSELFTFVERDELPMPTEICWFHKIDG